MEHPTQPEMPPSESINQESSNSLLKRLEHQIKVLKILMICFFLLLTTVFIWLLTRGQTGTGPGQISMRQSVQASVEESLRQTSRAEHIGRGYKIQYDRTVWKLENIQNPEGSRFILDPSYGLSRVSLFTPSLEEVRTKTDQELLERYVSASGVEDETVEVGNVEPATRWGLVGRRIEIIRTVLGIESRFEMIVLAPPEGAFSDVGYIVIDQTADVGETARYSRNLLDGVLVDVGYSDPFLDAGVSVPDPASDTPEVQGATDDRSVTERFTEVELVELSKPSVVSVMYTQCNDILFEDVQSVVSATGPADSSVDASTGTSIDTDDVLRNQQRVVPDADSRQSPSRGENQSDPERLQQTQELPQVTEEVVEVRQTYCFGGKGSGFIVSPDGVVATNGHVVKTYPEESILANALVSPELQEFIYAYVQGTPQRLNDGSNLVSTEDLDYLTGILRQSPEVAETVLFSILQEIDKGDITIEEGTPRYYIKLDDRPFLFNHDQLTSTTEATFVAQQDSVKTAELIDMNYGNTFSLANYFIYPGADTGDASFDPGKDADDTSDAATDEASLLEEASMQAETGTSDIALLKIADAGETVFPALELGDPTQLKEGQELLVIGYPALTEGTPQNSGLPSIVDYYTSSGRQSVTRGIVSAIKSDINGRLLIQTDASLEQGNSGGPAFTYDGTVVGIATYAFESGSGNYNLLRGVGDLAELMVANDISFESNQSYQAWRDGLVGFWNGSYEEAAASFETVATAYPGHPLVDGYLADARAGVDNNLCDPSTGEGCPVEDGAAQGRTSILSGLSPVGIAALASVALIAGMLLIMIVWQAVQIARLRKMVFAVSARVR